MAHSDKKAPSSVHDLRSALALLKTLPGEYVETDTEVDPHAELSGVYRTAGKGTRAASREARAVNRGLRHACRRPRRFT